jgi:hypothetical protein
MRLREADGLSLPEIKGTIRVSLPFHAIVVGTQYYASQSFVTGHHENANSAPDVYDSFHPTDACSLRWGADQT